MWWHGFLSGVCFVYLISAAVFCGACLTAVDLPDEQRPASA